MNKEKEIIKNISIERLETYRIDPSDSIQDLVERYLKNIQLGQLFYPALALLEVTLRNQISTAINKYIKENWLLEETRTYTHLILLTKEHELLMEAYDKLNKPFYNKNGELINREITEGKIIAELNFGFWVNLCNDKYNPNIWMKKPIIFDEIFPYFDEFIAKKNPTSKRHKRINKVASKLAPTLKLRNRIFHHEPIFNHPKGILNCYNDIEELLLYMSLETSECLTTISTFEEHYEKFL